MPTPVIDLTESAPATSTASTTDSGGQRRPGHPVPHCGRHLGARQVRPAEGSPAAGTASHGSLIDVTADEAIRRTWRRFAELVERDPVGCLVLEFLDPTDPETLVIRAANRAAHAMSAWSRGGRRHPAGVVLGPASAQLIRSAVFDVSHTGEPMTAERLSLTEVRGTYLDLRVDRLADGTIGMVVTDVTGTAALEERLRHQASHDALTGLPNRSLFEERLAGAVAEVTADAPAALILVDIDRLRDVNESHGLHIGDQLLVEVGRRLVREVRGASIVSRIDGDEFAVLTMPSRAAPRRPSGRGQSAPRWPGRSTSRGTCSACRPASAW